MKAIEIKLQGVVKPYYSIVKKEDNGRCYVSDRAAKFIAAQSQDNQVYYGTEPISIDSLYCDDNGSITNYYIKGNVYDDKTNPFVPKDGVFEWRCVELRVIDIMG